MIDRTHIAIFPTTLTILLKIIVILCITLLFLYPSLALTQSATPTTQKNFQLISSTSATLPTTSPIVSRESTMLPATRPAFSPKIETLSPMFDFSSAMFDYSSQNYETFSLQTQTLSPRFGFFPKSSFSFCATYPAFSTPKPTFSPIFHTLSPINEFLSSTKVLTTSSKLGLAALFGLLFSLFAWKSSSKVKLYRIKRWFLRIYISSAKNQLRFALLYRKLALKLLWLLAQWELAFRSRFGIWEVRKRIWRILQGLSFFTTSGIFLRNKHGGLLGEFGDLGERFMFVRGIRI